MKDFRAFGFRAAAETAMQASMCKIGRTSLQGPNGSWPCKFPKVHVPIYYVFLQYAGIVERLYGESV